MRTIRINSECSMPSVDADYSTALEVPNGRDVHIQAEDSGYAVVAEGEAVIEYCGWTFTAFAGMYFTVPGPAVIRGLVGYVCIRHGYAGIFSLGGPAGNRGRLKYIDGCSDTLLISPLVQGDPCLNLLYAPPRVSQTAHTHPSVRVGVVLTGNGVCRSEMTGEHKLEHGSIFVLEPGEVHSFHTRDESLRIVVYHPESDFGPTHDAHPMVQRTVVDGVSVAGNLQLQTKMIA